MNKKNLTRVAGLSAAAMLALSGMAMAETTESALVKGGALNLRETASLDAKVLGQYPTGTLVEIIKAGSEWHRVSVNGKTGYMLAKYLNSADSAISATVRTNTGTGLNLREQPNMNGTIIMAVKNGQSVSVLQKSSPWSRVKVGNREGYVATKYLNFGSSSGSVSGTAAVVHNPKSTQVLNLRREPNPRRAGAGILSQRHKGDDSGQCGQQVGQSTGDGRQDWLHDEAVLEGERGSGRSEAVHGKAVECQRRQLCEFPQGRVAECGSTCARAGGDGSEGAGARHGLVQG